MRVKFLPVSVVAFAVVIGILVLAAASGAQDSHPAGLFLDAFQKHWNTAKELSLAVADAMPAESYDFKASPPEMSFGEQMMHIAAANYGYCSLIAEAKSPYQEPAKDAKTEKASAMKELGASFDYCSKIFAGLDEAKLAQQHAAGKRSLSTMDAMLGVMVHMAHHRGQVEVYLRLKGITPPKYEF